MIDLWCKNNSVLLIRLHQLILSMLVPSVSVSTLPPTVNVSFGSKCNKCSSSEVNNVVNVAAAVPDITVNATSSL